MLRMRTNSIYIKFMLILLLTVAMVLSAGFIAAYKLRMHLLRNTAQAVAEQVIAFRSWVSGSGVVWVNNLKPEAPDFLGKTGCGDMSFYSKNPALATRELSTIVAQSNVHATFRVTSDNFRNAANLPDGFETNAIHTFKTSLVRPLDQQARFIETFEGNKYRYAIPIKVAESCLRCHGSPEEAPKEVTEKYGNVRAFNYRTGDIRGIITVDLPNMSLYSTSPIANSYSLILIVAAFFVNFFLLKWIVVDRIKTMTKMTEKMIQGELTGDMADYYKKNSRDEIDKLYNALDLMKKSIKIALDKLKSR